MIYAWVSMPAALLKITDDDSMSTQQLSCKVIDWLQSLERKRNPEATLDAVKFEVNGLETIISYRHRSPNFHTSTSVSFYQVNHEIDTRNPRNCPSKYDLLPITGLCESIRFNPKVDLSVAERQAIRDKAEDERIDRKWAALGSI